MVGQGWLVGSEVGLIGAKMILRALSGNGYHELAYAPGRVGYETAAYQLNGKSYKQTAEETGTALETVRKQRAKGVGG
jgi:hypothetical protein